APTVPGAYLRNIVRLETVTPALHRPIHTVFLERLVPGIPLVWKWQKRKRPVLPTCPTIGFRVDGSHAALLGDGNLRYGHFGWSHFVDRIILQRAFLAIAFECFS